MKILRSIGLVLVGLVLVSSLAYADDTAAASALIDALQATVGGVPAAGIAARQDLLGTLLPTSGGIAGLEGIEGAYEELYGMLYDQYGNYTLANDDPIAYTNTLIAGQKLLVELRKVVADPANTTGLTGLQVLSGVTGMVFPASGQLNISDQVQIDSFFGLMFTLDTDNVTVIHTIAYSNPAQFCSIQFRTYGLMTALRDSDAATKSAFANLFGITVVDPPYSDPTYVQKLFDISGGTYYTTAATFIAAMNKANALDTALQGASAIAKANFATIYGASIASPASSSVTYVTKLFGINYTTTAAFVTSLENASGTGMLSQVLGLDSDAKTAFENLYNQPVDGSSAYLTIVGGLEVDPANGIINLATATVFAGKMKNVYALHVALNGDAAAYGIFFNFYDETPSVLPALCPAIAGTDADYVEKLYDVVLGSGYVDVATYIGYLTAADALHDKFIAEPGTTGAAFTGTYGIAVPGSAPYSSAYVTALFSIVTGDTYSIANFAADLIKVNALDAYLQSTVPDRSAERTAFAALFGDAVVAVGNPARADYVGTLFGVVLDSFYTTPAAFATNLLLANILDGALRADSDALSTFEIFYGVTSGNHAYDSPDYVAALFGVVSASGYPGAPTYITNLKLAISLGDVIALDASAQTAFTNLYVPYAIVGDEPARTTYLTKLSDIINDPVYPVKTPAAIGTFISNMKKAHNLDQAMRADAGVLTAATAFARMYDITIPAAGLTAASTVTGYVEELYSVISYVGYSAPADYIITLKSAYTLDDTLQTHPGIGNSYWNAFANLFGVTVSDPATDADYQEKLFSIVSGSSYAATTPLDFIDAMKKASDLDVELRKVANATALAVFEELYSVTAPVNTHDDADYVAALFGVEYTDLASYINSLKATDSLDAVLQLDALAQTAFTNIYGVVFNGVGYQTKVLEISASNNFGNDLAAINAYVANLKNSHILDQALRLDVPAQTAFLRLYGIDMTAIGADYASTVTDYVKQLFGIVAYSFYPGAATSLVNMKAAYALDQALQADGTTYTPFQTMYGAKVVSTVTVYADSGNHPGVNTTITSAAHGLADGDTVVISGTTGGEYDGQWTVEHVTTDTFDIVKVYGTNPAAKGTFINSDYISQLFSVVSYYVSPTDKYVDPATYIAQLKAAMALHTELHKAGNEDVLKIFNSAYLGSETAVTVPPYANAAYVAALFGANVTGDPAVYVAALRASNNFDSALGLDTDAQAAFFRIYGVAYPPAGIPSAFADSTAHPGVNTTVTCAGHGLLDGDVVIISGTSGVFDGTYTVEHVTATTFDIVKVFAAYTATGSWILNDAAYQAVRNIIVNDPTYPVANTAQRLAFFANLKKVDALDALLQTDSDARDAFLAIYGITVAMPASSETIAISAYADSAYHTLVNTTVTSVGHGLSNGSTIHIVGSTLAQYDGTWVVEHVTANTFDIVKAFGTDPAAKGGWATTTYGYRAQLFSIVVYSLYPGASDMVADMKQVSALHALLTADLHAEADYLKLYGYAVPANAYSDLTQYVPQLFGVVVNTYYTTPAAYIVALKAAGDLDTALQLPANGTIRTQFAAMEGVTVPAEPYQYIDDADPTKHTNYLAYQAYLQKIFDVTGGEYYTTPTAYFTVMDKAYTLNTAIQADSDAKAAFLSMYGITVPALPSSSSTYLEQLYSIVTYDKTALPGADPNNKYIDPATYLSTLKKVDALDTALQSDASARTWFGTMEGVAVTFPAPATYVAHTDPAYLAYLTKLFDVASGFVPTITFTDIIDSDNLRTALKGTGDNAVVFLSLDLGTNTTILDIISDGDLADVMSTEILPHIYISAYADSTVHSGINTKVTSVAHGLSDGDSIVITGSTGAQYDGAWVVEHVTADTFDIVRVFGTDPAVKGDWDPAVVGISAYADSIDHSGINTRVTSTAHGLSDGDIVVIKGSTGAQYDGAWVIEHKTADTFDIVKVFGTDPTVSGNWTTIHDFHSSLIDADVYRPSLDAEMQSILTRAQASDPTLTEQQYAWLNRALLNAMYPLALNTYVDTYLANLQRVYDYHQALLASSQSVKDAFEAIYGMAQSVPPTASVSYVETLYMIVTNQYYQDGGVTSAQAAARQLGYVAAADSLDRKLNGYRYAFRGYTGYYWTANAEVGNQDWSNNAYAEKIFTLVSGGLKQLPNTQIPYNENTLLTSLSTTNTNLKYSTVEGDLVYILNCQITTSTDPAYGAINSIHPTGTGTSGTHTHAASDATNIVPREMAMAIVALMEVYDNYKNDANYLAKAKLAAGYLAKVQAADGAWYDQYSGVGNALNSKSLTQTAEVMLALGKIGFDESKYTAMKKGAQFLISCQNSTYGLLGGGKDLLGDPVTNMWASDNSYAYQALKAAEFWATAYDDVAFATQCSNVAADIVAGINTWLYNSVTGAWYEAINSSGTPVDPNSNGYEWKSYAPAMLDVPVFGATDAALGTWIHDTFQLADGSVRGCTTGADSTKLSAEFAFQAMQVWFDLGQYDYIKQAFDWVQGQGLITADPDGDNIADIIEMVVNGNRSGTTLTGGTADSDLDGVYDVIENKLYGDLHVDMSVKGLYTDHDGDGVIDLVEKLVNGNLDGTSIPTADTDGDNIADSIETAVYGNLNRYNLTGSGLWRDILNTSSTGAQQSRFGWIDWINSLSGIKQTDSQRFIDTSAWAALAMMGGYDFNPSAVPAVEEEFTDSLMLVTDYDNDGKKEFMGDFGTAGIWTMDDNGSWSQFNSTNPETMLVTDYDNDSKKEFMGDFGTAGIWTMDDNGTWNKFNNTNPETMLVTDYDNDSKKEFMGDFGTAGIWTMDDNGSWSQFNSTSTVLSQAAYLPRGDEELATRMSLESTLTQDNSGTNYTQAGTLADPPAMENLLPKF